MVDEVAEALVDEKDPRTRTDMVELVIVALLKVFVHSYCLLFISPRSLLFLLAQLPSDQFYLEEISGQLLPALQDPKCKWVASLMLFIRIFFSSSDQLMFWQGEASCVGGGCCLRSTACQ